MVCNESTATVAAGAALTVIAARPGRLGRVLVAASGTAAATLYDNASAASGTVVGYVPANAAAGTVYDLRMPCGNGIVAAGGAGSPALTVAFQAG